MASYRDQPEGVVEATLNSASSTSATTEVSGPAAEVSKESETSSSNGIVNSTLSPNVVPNLKRPSLEPSPEEPRSKKSKGASPASARKIGASKSLPSPPLHDLPVPVIDKSTWQGFCDIESEPAYFSVILREMGVEDVTVREVFTMDPDYLLDSLPQPIHGLILLFHYREFGNADQPSECPADVWFANQLPAQNSCATLAMLNILMNSPDVVFGEHLDQFKDFTRDFTPFQRGEALASFDFVKRIHNSFAKRMDILESDKYLSYKVKKAQRLNQQEKAANPTNTAATATSRRGSADSTTTNDSAASHEENAHHYIAFVPVGTEVWKLDGLDAQPTSMGTFDVDKGETWLSAVSDTIGALMAVGDDDYGVIAVSQSPLRALRHRACLTTNIVSHVEKRLASLAPDWRAFLPSDAHEPPCPRLLGIDAHLTSHPVPEVLMATIEAEVLPALLDRRARLVKELDQLAMSILKEVQDEADEDQKATQRRFDCGPVIKKWLEMLAENGHLERNLERFMPVGVKKSGGGGGKKKSKKKK